MELSTTQLSRFALRGEQDVSTEIPFLVDRFSPAIISGTAVYALPQDTISIKRVTWLGQKIYPLDHRRWRESTIQNNQSGLPYSYIFNNTGLLEIQFFYVPNANIVAGVGDLWSPVVIPSCVIIEFWRTADGVNFKLPDYCRHRLLKYYLAYQANKVEGPGQVGQMSKYFKGRWGDWQTIFKNHVRDMVDKPRKLALSDIPDVSTFPLTRRLPWNFGVSVDD